MGNTVHIQAMYDMNNKHKIPPEHSSPPEDENNVLYDDMNNENNENNVLCDATNSENHQLDVWLSYTNAW